MYLPWLIYKLKLTSKAWIFLNWDTCNGQRHILTERTVTFEQINQTLMRELNRKHQTYTSKDIFAEYKDIGLNLDPLRLNAQKRYHFRVD